MSITRLRRARVLGLLLALLTPALGGSVLRLVHPCPVEAPWTATATVAGGAHAHGHHGEAPTDAPAHHDEGGDCQCVGACAVQAVAAAPAVSIAAVPAPSFAAATPPLPTGALAHPAAVPLDLLPPAIAPPLA